MEEVSGEKLRACLYYMAKAFDPELAQCFEQCDDNKKACQLQLSSPRHGENQPRRFLESARKLHVAKASNMDADGYSTKIMDKYMANENVNEDEKRDERQYLQELMVQFAHKYHPLLALGGNVAPSSLENSTRDESPWKPSTVSVEERALGKLSLAETNLVVNDFGGLSEETSADLTVNFNSWDAKGEASNQSLFPPSPVCEAKNDFDGVSSPIKRLSSRKRMRIYLEDMRDVRKVSLLSLYETDKFGNPKEEMVIGNNSPVCIDESKLTSIDVDFTLEHQFDGIDSPDIKECVTAILKQIWPDVMECIRRETQKGGKEVSTRNRPVGVQ